MILHYRIEVKLLEESRRYENASGAWLTSRSKSYTFFNRKYHTYIESNGKF